MDKSRTSGDAAGREKGAGITGISRSFTGKLLGLFTHELNNHLATLRETVGLAEDIAGIGNSKDREKMKEVMQVIDSLRNIIDRTIYISRSLNSFGQHLEFPLQGGDIIAAINEILIPFFKKAMQGGVHLKKDMPMETLRVETDIFLLQLLLYCLIDNLITQLAGGSTVIIKVDSTPNSVSIRLVPDKMPSEGEMRWSREDLSSVAAGIRAEMHYEERTGSIAVTVPLR